MVVFSFPQCHCYGWSWCAQSSICHGRASDGVLVCLSWYSRGSLPCILCGKWSKCTSSFPVNVLIDTMNSDNTPLVKNLVYIVVPQQLLVEMKLTYFIMIFASVEFLLSLPNFDSISGVSLAAAVMSLSYSTIAWGASLSKGVQDDVQYGYKASTTAGTVFCFLSAWVM
ncbi:hypothetical protein F3Y22_tig00110388pilonHSYRG00036 [Hibiscus syriacus]|uniref:Amino acid transporter transmembrane domain-containing protein n=1 Tax=Hibiscus syriacus TaxID=106335 RepID=A0A6A3APW4_HIBSY|nr:hypothetical protein F3Y22_tig00110388pilonHSYRG00036 [Hibiscus syriacus]